MAKVYRLMHYNLAGWAIQLQKEKRDGTLAWSDWKYPGSLEAAAKSLFDVAIPEQEFETVEELLAAVQLAHTEILEKLSEIVLFDKDQIKKESK